MNRNLAMAAAIAAALTPAVPRAQMIVEDPTSIAQLVSAGKTAMSTFQEAKAIYAQTISIGQSLAHGTWINSIASQLESGTLNNPLGAMGGIGALTGPLLGQGGSAVPGAQAILQKAQLYNIPGADQVAQLLNQRAQSQADVQAIALQSVQVSQDRIAGLDEIAAQLTTANNIEDITAIQARLNAELAIGQAQQGQLQQVATLQQSMQNQADLQDQQLQRKSADEWAAAAKAAIQ